MGTFYNGRKIAIKQGLLDVDVSTSINAQLASVTNILPTLTLGQGSMTKAPV